MQCVRTRYCYVIKLIRVKKLEAMKEKKENENKTGLQVNIESPSKNTLVSNRGDSVSASNNEESALMDQVTMPEVVNTEVSSTTGTGPKADPKLSACYKFQRGTEVVARKLGKGCSDYWSSSCSLDNLKKKLPIVSWLPKYQLKTLKCDFIAGLTVGLTVIPQGMAYAALAGLELQVSHSF